MRMPSPEDDDLAAAQSGDVEALTRLIQARRQGVYRYGLQVCRTTEDAEDALQEAIWAATRAIRSFRGTASALTSWLFTIIRRECYRLVDRHREIPQPHEVLDVRAVEPSHEDQLATRRRADMLARAITALDHVDREVILLRDIEELSAPEAAARLGISVSALKSRLHRARVSLRDYLTERGL
jgi:RNA polymerase sigma-70 factor (ECF subfamily)